MREVSQKIKNSIEPKIYPEVRKVVIDGRDCIYVKFEENQTPDFSFGVARIRVAYEARKIEGKLLHYKRL